jgi:hypothetical protein
MVPPPACCDGASSALSPFVIGCLVRLKQSRSPRGQRVQRTASNDEGRPRTLRPTRLRSRGRTRPGLRAGAATRRRVRTSRLLTWRAGWTLTSTRRKAGLRTQLAGRALGLTPQLPEHDANARRHGSTMTVDPAIECTRSSNSFGRRRTPSQWQPCSAYLPPRTQLTHVKPRTRGPQRNGKPSRLARTHARQSGCIERALRHRTRPRPSTRPHRRTANESPRAAWCQSVVGWQ